MATGTLTDVQQRRLARCRNRRTLYELAVKHADGRAVLLGYCDRHSRNMLYRVACKHGPKLAALTGAESLTFGAKSRDGATIGDWSIVWTGRTQRDAIMEGELPYIAA